MDGRSGVDLATKFDGGRLSDKGVLAQLRVAYPSRGTDASHLTYRSSQRAKHALGTQGEGPLVQGNIFRVKIPDGRDFLIRQRPGFLGSIRDDRLESGVSKGGAKFSYATGHGRLDLRRCGSEVCPKFSEP